MTPEGAFKVLTGIHVSGYLRQSKCTLFVKPNLDWMKSIFSKDKKDLYQTEGWQNRIITFIDQFHKQGDKESLEINCILIL